MTMTEILKQARLLAAERELQQIVAPRPYVVGNVNPYTGHIGYVTRITPIRREIVYGTDDFRRALPLTAQERDEVMARFPDHGGNFFYAVPK